MKFFAAFLFTFVIVTAAHAETADVKDLAAKAKVSDSCAAKILAEATRRCNADSKAKEHGNREHECFYNYDGTAASGGAVNVEFTTGDADEWDYSVYVTDESDANSCDFTVKSAN